MSKKFIFILVILSFLAACNSQTKEELLQEGVRLGGQGNHKGSVVLFKNALEKDANYFEARYQLALSYLKMGKYEKAEKEFQKVLRQDPDNSEIRLKLAELYNFLQRPDAAIEQVALYHETSPATSATHEHLGGSYAIKKEWGEAERHFLKSIALDGENLSSKLFLSRVYFQAGGNDRGRRLLDEIIEQDPRHKLAYYEIARLEAAGGNRGAALDAYRKLVEIDPADVGALYMTGVLCLDAGEVAEGKKVVADLGERFPDHPSGPRLKGMLSYVEGDYEGAIAHLKQSLNGMPDFVGNYFLGLSYYKAGNLELALNGFQKSADLQPSHNPTRLLIAMTLLKQGRVDDSAAEVRKVLERQPANAMAHNILGSAYLAMKEFDLAMEELDRATELDPSLADAHVKKGLFNLASGRAGAGEADLAEALKAAPEVLNARLLLVSHYLRQQNYGGAVKALEEGMSGKAEDALLYNYMAAAYFAQNKAEEGIAALEKAKEAKRDYFTPYFNLAAYYASRSEDEKTLGEYRAVLQIDPGNIKALLNMAAVLELGDRGGEALAVYRRAKDTQAPDGFLALAGHLLRGGKSVEALEVLAAAQEAHPANPAVLETRGKALISGGEYEAGERVFQVLDAANPGRGGLLLVDSYLRQEKREEARALARQLIADRPGFAYGYLLLASVEQRLKSPAEAEKVLKEGLASVEGDPRLKMELGRVYERMGKDELAASSYRAVAEENPRFAPALFALGALYDRTGSKGEALELYKKTLSKAPDYIPALNNLAYLYAENYGSPEEALWLALKAYRKAPGNPGIIDTLGYALLANGRYEEAYKILGKALSLLPENPQVLMHYALACRGAGKESEASSALQKVLRFGTEVEAREARKLLVEVAAS